VHLVSLVCPSAGLLLREDCSCIESMELINALAVHLMDFVFGDLYAPYVKALA